jgi:hypothetical protein
MADIGSGANWLVSPTAEVEQMWKKVQIQEKKSAVSACDRSIAESRQKIADIENGIIVGLEARKKMLQMEIRKLESDKIVNAETQ